jgi:hypothetical protein
MTGGVGFTKMGQESYKHNRELLNQRHLMKENPFSPFNKIPYEKAAENFEEIKKWKLQKEKGEKKKRLIIYAII